MANVEGAGGVGRNKLHLNFFALALVVAAETVAFIQYGVDHFKSTGRAHEEVDETGPGNLHFLHRFALRQLLDKRLRQFARRTTGSLRGNQGNVAGVVAVGLVLGIAYLWSEGLVRRQSAIGLECCQCRLEQIGNGLFHAVR